MTKTTPVRPYEHTTMSQFLAKQLDTLSDLGIAQRDVASAAGYDKPNIMSMYKRGETKVPLDKVVVLAKALRVDPAFLFRLAAQQPNAPISAQDIDKIFPNSVTKDEMRIVEAIREVAGNREINPTDAQLDKVRELFAHDERKGISPVPKSL